jgi:uncharacterized protein YbcI
MTARPQDAAVAFCEPYLIVTLGGVLSPAEREYAQQQLPRQRLEKLYAEVFEAVEAQLQVAVAAIVGRSVCGSRISIDTLLGDAIVTFVLGPARGHENEQSKGTGKMPARRKEDRQCRS